jgi:hypothetical protein
MAGFVGGINDKSTIFRAMWILVAVSFVSMLAGMFVPYTSSTFQWVWLVFLQCVLLWFYQL